MEIVYGMAIPSVVFLRLRELQVQRAAHETRVRTASIPKATHQDDAQHTSNLGQKKKRVVNLLMFLLGLGVLATHIVAEILSVAGRGTGSLLEMMPFGPTQYTCAALEVSCLQEQISGTKSELDNALSKVDATSLQDLTSFPSLRSALNVSAAHNVLQAD